MSNPAPTSDRLRSWLHQWVVPVLLIGIAVQQMLWVHVDGLSPWKGGGFGMFSTVDKRILRVQVVRGEGPPYSLDLISTNPVFETAKSRAITKPDEAALTKVAELMLAVDFVPVDLKQRLLSQQIEGIPKPRQSAGAWSRYRMRGAHETWMGDEEAVRFQKVRVQVWRLRFDAETGRLASESVGPVVELER